MTAQPPKSAPKARAAQLRAVALWALSLSLTLGVAGLLAWAGLLLAVFGLAGVALAGSVVMTAVGLTVWRRGMLPLAALSAALTLPAAAVAVGTLRLERSIGLLEVHPARAAELSQDTYRQGSGPIFFDLRKMAFGAGTTTRIKAKADNGAIIVALPHDACVATEITVQRRTEVGFEGYSAVRQLTNASLRMAGVASAQAGEMYYGTMGMAEGPQLGLQNFLEQAPQDLVAASYGLLAYGRNPMGISQFGDVYRWSRPVGRPGAAKLELHLDATQQIVVRDYPDWAAPLADGMVDGYDQVSGVDWPAAVTAPVSPGNLAIRHRASIRTPENRSRWLDWERKAVKWGIEQAHRYAGPCATRQQLEVRGVQFTIQPETVKVGGRPKRVAGVRRSTIEQPVARDAASTFVYEVNGLGELRFLGENRPGNPYGARSTRAQHELENAR